MTRVDASAFIKLRSRLFRMTSEAESMQAGFAVKSSKELSQVQRVLIRPEMALPDHFTPTLTLPLRGRGLGETLT